MGVREESKFYSLENWVFYTLCMFGLELRDGVLIWLCDSGLGCIQS
jgi:purine-cytosine permease-like protein